VAVTPWWTPTKPSNGWNRLGRSCASEAGHLLPGQTQPILDFLRG
jgi:hypothetical protein